MTKAVVEPAFSAGKPKRLLDQMRYFARESHPPVLGQAAG